jgi:hypothetical protein
MFRIPAEFQDVPLRNASVLEQFPGRMGRALGFFTAQALGESFEHGGPSHMRFIRGQKLAQMCLQDFIVQGTQPPVLALF